jgi:hypothetical protein
MQITNVKNPKYLFPDNDKILCEVQIDNSESWQEFLAVSDDPEVHGRELHTALLAGTYGDIAPYTPLIATAEKNKYEASILLLQTDWVLQADVVDVTLTPHLLNQSEFITYRAALREIAVNPIDGNVNFPVKPQPQWSS